ncbi:glycosyltransferase family 39 protein [Mucilaginibacter sp. SG564]|uniref:glycosyltransferase family 39 protein n=1 Tax=Mucilaginibacter sp. SG564 TaxID=2587022 RepID=UPI0015554267|nr:glycosyltransferase family 39 protein [Mucilaginibacter sp. SG564]NOW98440.1 hypothetical protein [Mucilaginibacter sp. SG564]
MQESNLNNTQAPVNYNRPVIYFLLLWTALNILQASTLEIHADEAYYWMYSRFLDWGYYDHPPMVALFIKAGYSLMHNEFGLRLFTVLSSSISLYLIWLMLKKYQVSAKAFILVIPGVFVFHIYGFTTTPDAPLLLFTTLFFFFYQQYAERDSWPLALILAMVVAGLLYSKYHGVLVVGFTLLSNLKLLKRPSFWGIVILALVFYAPHILWQINHDYPSIKYHLSERSAETYDLSYSYQYPLGQLIMAGPLIGWFLFYKSFTVRIKDTFMRTLLVNSIGILLFFFLTSFKGEVQLHWTLIVYVPLCMLVLIHFAQRGWPAWFSRLAIINMALIVTLRLLIVWGPSFIMEVGAIRSFFGFKDWAKTVRDKAGDNYVIFCEGFQNPSKYNFYNNTVKGLNYDARYYRRTQYDIWPIDDSVQHKKAYLVMEDRIPGVTPDTIKTPVGNWYAGWVNNVRTYQKIDFKPSSYKVTASPGQRLTFDLSFKNTYSFPINFGNGPGEPPVYLEACFFENSDLVNTQKASDSFYHIALQPGQTTPYKFTLTAPLKKGRYDLLFSLRTEPFAGGRNSGMITFTVK